VECGGEYVGAIGQEAEFELAPVLLGKRERSLKAESGKTSPKPDSKKISPHTPSHYSTECRSN
jgi:hypothetical protein